METIKKSGIMIALALTAGMAGAGIFHQFIKDSSPSNLDGYSHRTPARQINFEGPVSAPADFTIAAEGTVPTVVHVTTTYARQQGYNSQFFDPFNFFWGNPTPQQMPQQQSTGSGVIISADGYIVTNNHVVENAEMVSVTLDDKSTYTAKVVGVDPSTDLALLKIEANNVTILGYKENISGNFKAVYSIGIIKADDLENASAKKLPKGLFLKSLGGNFSNTPIQYGGDSKSLKSVKLENNVITIELNPLAFDKNDKIIVSAGEIEGSYEDKINYIFIPSLKTVLPPNNTDFTIITDPSGRGINKGNPSILDNIYINNSQKSSIAN